MRYLALIAFIAVANTANAKMVEKPMNYTDGTTKMKGVLYYDDEINAMRPGVVIYPEWWGQNDYIKQRGKEVASKGYIVLVADMYGDAKKTAKVDDAKAWSSPLYADRAVMESRAKAAVETLGSQNFVAKSKIALMGFCFGGTVALDLARTGADVKSVSAFHAGLDFPAEPAKDIKAKLLVLNGAADPMVPFEARQKFIEEANKGNTDLQFIEYSGAMHAFTNPKADGYGIPGVAYNKKAEERSFAYMYEFLKETLK